MREGKRKIVHDRKTGNAPALDNLKSDIGEPKDLSAKRKFLVLPIRVGLDKPIWVNLMRGLEKNPPTEMLSGF